MPFYPLRHHLRLYRPNIRTSFLQPPRTVSINSYAIHTFYAFELRNKVSSKCGLNTHYKERVRFTKNSYFELHPTKPIVLSSNAFLIISQSSRGFHHFSTLLAQSSPDQTPSSNASASQNSGGAVAKVVPKKSLWEKTKEECSHYWHGTKLLWANVKVAWGLSRRLMKGETLSRREHKQVR